MGQLPSSSGTTLLFGVLVRNTRIGLAVALLVTRPLAMFFVPGLSASDPASFATVVVVLGLTGVLAALGPMRRALAVDPVQCLRCEYKPGDKC